MTKAQALVIGMLVGWTAMFLVAAVICTPDTQWHREAVERGHAEYYFDKEYNRQWRWK